MPNMSIPYLPVEVIGIVAEHLGKLHLKTLRLVSKSWCATATPLLFDRIYISTRRTDIKVFRKITRHPILSNSVKELVYDVSNVHEMSHDEYFQFLWAELGNILRPWEREISVNGPDSRLNQFYRAIQDTPCSSEVFLEYGNDKVVIEGFRKWQELLEEESHCFGVGSNRVCSLDLDLCSGLYRLPNLRSVTMDDDIWDQNRRELRHTITQTSFDPSVYGISVPTGSPLARSWNFSHLRPNRPGLVPVHFHQHLAHVVRALSSTETKIRHFTCGSFGELGLNPSAFSYEMTESFPRHMIDALSQLASLTLGIAPDKDSYVIFKDPVPKTMGFLPELLNRMNGLKSLELNFLTSGRVERTRSSFSPALDESCYTYREIFPYRGEWSRLEHLTLRGLAIEGVELITLLRLKTPLLKRLWLDRIDLVNCRWEGAIEAMCYLPLCWEVLGLYGPFRHCKGEGWPYPSCVPKEAQLELNKMAAYIKDGGRHPSLPTHCQDSQSIDYFDDMCRAESVWHQRIFCAYGTERCIGGKAWPLPDLPS